MDAVPTENVHANASQNSHMSILEDREEDDNVCMGESQEVRFHYEIAVRLRRRLFFSFRMPLCLTILHTELHPTRNEPKLRRIDPTRPRRRRFLPPPSASRMQFSPDTHRSPHHPLGTTAPPKQSIETLRHDATQSQSRLRHSFQISLPRTGQTQSHAALVPAVIHGTEEFVSLGSFQRVRLGEVGQGGRHRRENHPRTRKRRRQ